MATTEVKPSADKNPKKTRKPPLGPKKDLKKTKKSKALAFDNIIERDDHNSENDGDEQQPASASEQLSFFLKLLDSAIDKCIVELSRGLDQNVSNLGEHIKKSLGSSRRETRCDGEEGKVDPGNPSVLVVSSCRELLCSEIFGTSKVSL
ncbi:hypothetical protein Bca101_018048 [Brassica carinata]